MGSGSVSVIDGSTNTISSTVSFSVAFPWGVAVNPNTNMIYVNDVDSNSTFVINGASNAVVKSIPGANYPVGVAVNANTNRVYVVNRFSHSVSVIDGSTNTLVTSIQVGYAPFGAWTLILTLTRFT